MLIDVTVPCTTATRRVVARRFAPDGQHVTADDPRVLAEGSGSCTDTWVSPPPKPTAPPRVCLAERGTHGGAVGFGWRKGSRKSPIAINRPSRVSGPAGSSG